MHTLAPTVDSRPASFTTPPTADLLLHSPLPHLLAEFDVLLYDSSITDAGFYGAVVERRDGQLILSMPAGRSAREHDTVARYLIAQVFDVNLPKLRAPFVTSELCSPASRELT